ncbi:MAG: response regulator [Nitrospirota bacterium]|nr:response regulator [Nitrospirota bacterium]
MEPKLRILVVDDERDILQLVTYNLKKDGYLVDEAMTGDDALRMVRERPYQLILLDLMLPGMSGMELCRIFKKDPATAAVPVIMLTARADEMDKIMGLETGADDYVTKPFSVRELMARVKSVLRRTEGGVTAEKVLRAGTLAVDLERHLVQSGGITIDLSPIEFRLLRFLMERKGRVFTRDRILDAVWKGEAFVEERTVDVHIRRLRAELEKAGIVEFIRTVRGVGYSFSDES